MPYLFDSPLIGVRLLDLLRRDAEMCRRGMVLATAALYKIAFVLTLALVCGDGLSELEEKAESTKEVQGAVCSAWTRRPRSTLHSQAIHKVDHGLSAPQVDSFIARTAKLPFSIDISIANGLRAPPCA